MTRQVACPACGKPVAWTQQNQWRPFCSERCKTIDLGDWAANRHVVVGSGEDVEPSSTPPEESNRGARVPSKHSGS